MAALRAPAAGTLALLGEGAVSGGGGGGGRWGRVGSP